uniref:Mutator-like transposase domain-containing protein n=1 Tax=Branchiostoma floridae TaxID=7739 RepID=C3YMB3_BRAFL|eukprot:XP_002602695.1 hypothetical protein BRAFLDRAFT_72946 [Branchiostoma floridae]
MGKNPWRRKRRRDKGPHSGRFKQNNTQQKKRLLTEEDEGQFEKICRLKKDVWGRAREEDVNPTPGRLRPLPAGPTELEKLKLESSDNGNIDVGENIPDHRSFSVPLLMTLMNDFSDRHAQESPTCLKPVFVMPKDGERARGFVFQETVKCGKCGYRLGPVKLYEESERLPGKTRGPKPAKKNVQFAVALTKIGIGITAAKTLMSGMDAHAPSLSAMHHLNTAVCDSLEGILQKSLAENRGKYRHAMELRGKLVEKGKPLAGTGAGDGCYNNPSFYGVSQRATQAALPVIETGTQDQMMIGFGFANKLCKNEVTE